MIELPPELVEEIRFSMMCRSRWLDWAENILIRVGLATGIPTESFVYYYTTVDDSGEQRHISWSPFHRWLYYYWNNWLIFWLRVKYWIKLGAWF